MALKNNILKLLMLHTITGCQEVGRKTRFIHSHAASMFYEYITIYNHFLDGVCVCVEYKNNFLHDHFF